MLRLLHRDFAKKEWHGGCTNFTQMTITVEKIMSTALVTAKPEDTIAESDIEMTLAGVRHLPVVDDRRRLIGIVSDRDMLRAVARSKPTPIRVADITTLAVETIHYGEPASRAVEMMLERKFGCVPVLGDEGQLVGLVTATDFLRFAHDYLTS